MSDKARIAVEDGETKQKLLDVIDVVETTRAVRERLAAIDRGEAGVSVEQVLRDIRKRVRDQTEVVAGLLHGCHEILI